MLGEAVVLGLRIAAFVSTSRCEIETLLPLRNTSTTSVIRPVLLVRMTSITAEAYSVQCIVHSA